MKESEVAQLRTMYVFTPPGGRDWNLSMEAMADRLCERNRDEFIRIEDSTEDPAPGSGSRLHFGITLLDEDMEGFGKEDPQGIALRDSTARLAAEFVFWLRLSVVPAHAKIEFNTEWGIEEDLPDATVPEGSVEELTETFLDHIVATGGLDDE